MSLMRLICHSDVIRPPAPLSAPERDELAIASGMLTSWVSPAGWVAVLECSEALVGVVFGERRIQEPRRGGVTLEGL